MKYLKVRIIGLVCLVVMGSVLVCPNFTSARMMRGDDVSGLETNINLAILKKALNKASIDLKRKLNIDLVLTLGGSAGLLSLVQNTIPSRTIYDFDIEVNLYGRIDHLGEDCVEVLIDEVKKSVNKTLENSGIQVDEKSGLFQLVINSPEGNKEYELDFLIKDLNQPLTSKNIRAFHVDFLIQRFKVGGSIFWTKEREIGVGILWIEGRQDNMQITMRIIDWKTEPRKYIVRYLRHECFFGEERIFRQVAKEFIDANEEDYLKMAEKIKESGRVEVLTDRLIDKIRMEFDF